MRKAILLTLSLCLFSGQLLFAQSEKNVPAVVTAAFQEKYPNMTVTDWDWEDDKNAYEAEFKMDGKEMEAFFSESGEWLKTKAELDKNQVPAAVSKAYSSGEDANWSKSNYMEMDTPDKGKLYKVKAEKGNAEHYLKYDANGKLVEKMDKAEKKKMKK